MSEINLLEIMKLVSTIFNEEVMIPVIVLFGILFFFFKKRTWDVLLISSGLFTMAIIYSLKIIINKPRPDNMLIVEGVGKAFPSGHSAIAGVFTVLAIYFMYKHINLKNSISIFILYIFVFISFLLVPISRLYLHVHDIYDVVAGYSIGVIVTIFCVNYSHKFFRRKDY